MTKESSLFSGRDMKFAVVPGGKPKKKKMQREEKVQIKVCNYLQKAYPDVVFTCDLASGMKLPVWIAKKNKEMRSSRGLPDLFIAHPSYTHRQPALANLFYGLFIELKSDGVTVFNKDGSLRKDEHLAEQHAILQDLSKKGYKAVFAVGYDEAVKIIDEYMNKNS